MNCVYEIIHNNLHNTISGRNQIIDIKYHLHTLAFLNESNKFIVDLKKNAYTLSRTI